MSIVEMTTRATYATLFRLRALAGATLVGFALVSCGVLDPNPHATITGPGPHDSLAIDTGQSVYERECAVCHGIDGIARVNADPLSEYTGTFEQFDAVLLRPPPLMPIFSYQRIDSLSRHRLYEYIQTFK